MYLEGEECSQFDDFRLEDINRQFVNLHTIWLIVRLDLETTQLNTTTLQGLTLSMDQEDTMELEIEYNYLIHNKVHKHINVIRNTDLKTPDVNGL